MMDPSVATTLSRQFTRAMRACRSLCVLAVFFFVLGTTSLAVAGARVALVIGNATYSDVPLANPRNDANDIASALSRLSFKVTTLVDADQSQIEQAIERFGADISGAEIALFYFAGHGVQVDGRNYLLPVGRAFTLENHVRDRAVSLGDVLETMELSGSSANLVILDACRNNPFKASFRSASRGLARVDGPVGSFIAFATAEGQVADDGGGRNGLFTGSLLKHIEAPGLSIDQIMTRVRADVMRDSGSRQVPWSNSSLPVEVYFQPRTGANYSSIPILPAADSVKPNAGKTYRATIRSNVHNDNVTINGRAYGSTRLTVDLLPGTYNVRVEKEGYYPFASSLSVVAGREALLSAELVPDTRIATQLKPLIETGTDVAKQTADLASQGAETVGRWTAAILRLMAIVAGALIVLLVYLVSSGRLRRIVEWMNE